MILFREIRSQRTNRCDTGEWGILIPGQVYKVLDPASAVAKRHVLAEHLREVIDLLELKVGCVGVGVTAYIPYQLRWGVGVSWRRGRPGLFLLTFDR
jgi:hypothetical protein